LVIPFFDFSFNGAADDSSEYPITTIDIARQYDGPADTPEFLLNPIADLNAISASSSCTSSTARR
jgi:PE-PPE domain-containing protein